MNGQGQQGRPRRFASATAFTGLVLFLGSLVLVVPTLPAVPLRWWLLTLVAMGTIVIGDVWRVNVLDSRDFAPVALAACLALAMTSGLPGGVGVDSAAALVVVSTAVATYVGNLLRQRLTGEPPPWADLGVRVIVVALAASLYRVLPFGDDTLLEHTAGWSDRRWLVAVTMLAVATLALSVQVAVMSVRRSLRDHAAVHQAVLDEIIAVGPLLLATTTTAAVVALAVGAVGPVAVPLFMAPLVLHQLAVGRQSAVRAARRQTIRALSRLTEQSGFTPPGHAARVARLAVPMGRELGLSERELIDLEYAALLHDLGQVSLRRPIPGGATTLTAPLDQRRIAAAGAAILARTTDLSRVAPVVAQQAAPYHRARDIGEVPVQCSILKVANAFDDLVGPRVSAAAAVAGLERLRLGVDYEYDPAVVRCLARILEREGLVSPQDIAALDV